MNQNCYIVHGYRLAAVYALIFPSCVECLSFRPYAASHL